MKNNILQKYILLLFLFVLTIDISAQICVPIDRCGYTIEEINQRMPWNLSDNTAGLVHYNLLDYSSVGTFYNSETGDYRNYNTPESVWKAGAYTQAYQKINKMYFYGDFRYEYDTKSNQSWLGTVLPDFTSNPVLDSIPGRVLQESYNMIGKVAYKLSDRIALGTEIKYNTSTIAKRKDGRNANVFSALDVKPGICFTFGDFSTGMNAIYQYWTDNVQYQYIGDESGKNIYYMEGLFFTTKSGITNTTILDRRYFMQTYGGAAQFNYRKNKLELFSQFKVESGNLNNYEGLGLLKRYSKEDLLKYYYDGYLKIIGKRTNHFIQLSIKENDRASYSIINNYEPVPEEIKSWQYHEKDKVLRYVELRKNIDASYRVCVKDNDWKYNFTVTGGYNKTWSDKTYKVYPDRYNQEYSINTMYLKATKFFYSGLKNIIELNGEFAVSDGSPAGKMLESTGTGNLGLLTLNRSMITQDFNYQNIARKNYSIGSRYRHILNPEKGNSFDLSVRYTLIQAKEKLNRTYLSLSTSYNF
jgi:hypothetical protein